jgi:hypothetical protein
MMSWATERWGICFLARTSSKCCCALRTPLRTRRTFAGCVAGCGAFASCARSAGRLLLIRRPRLHPFAQLQMRDERRFAARVQPRCRRCVGFKTLKILNHHRSPSIPLPNSAVSEAESPAQLTCPFLIRRPFPLPPQTRTMSTNDSRSLPALPAASAPAFNTAATG